MTLTEAATTTDVPIDFSTWRWLGLQGVPHEVMGWCSNLRMVDGKIAFYEPIDDDVVLWSARDALITSMRGRAFAIGGSEINASSGVLEPLRIHASPLDWLRDGARGIVIADWAQTFDRLRYVPRVAVPRGLMGQYRKVMQPAIPAVSVLEYERSAA